MANSSSIQCVELEIKNWPALDRARGSLGRVANGKSLKDLEGNSKLPGVEVHSKAW